VRRTALTTTYRRQLRERALDQYGYVTTRDAEELGVPGVELRKLHHRGGLEHVAYGLYRFEDIPHTAHDQFMEAVLRVGPDAVLAGDAVLALHDLALVNPRRIRVATPKRDRHRLPDFLKVERREVPPLERTTYEGIPATTVARALLDCRGIIMNERLIDATREAARMGLVRKSEAKHVFSELGATT
jgi:predicted transcriptional regulator of viral defense system